MPSSMRSCRTISANPKNTDSRCRMHQLADAHYNTNLLPQTAVVVDLMTDSWAERPFPLDDGPPLRATQIETFIREVYEFKHVLSLMQGRLGEAILGTAFAAPSSCILTNSIFPTAQFHLGSRPFGRPVVGADAVAHEQGG